MWPMMHCSQEHHIDLHSERANMSSDSTFCWTVLGCSLLEVPQCSGCQGLFLVGRGQSWDEYTLGLYLAAVIQFVRVWDRFTVRKIENPELWGSSIYVLFLFRSPYLKTVLEYHVIFVYFDARHCSISTPCKLITPGNWLFHFLIFVLRASQLLGQFL